MVTEFRFTCPVCEETFVVDESVRRSLIETGCVICLEPVTADAFVPVDATS